MTGTVDIHSGKRGGGFDRLKPIVHERWDELQVRLYRRRRDGAWKVEVDGGLNAGTFRMTGDPNAAGAFLTKLVGKLEEG